MTPKLWYPLNNPGQNLIYPVTETLITLFQASEDHFYFSIFLVKLLSEKSLIFPEYSNHNKDHGEKNGAARAFRAHNLTNASYWASCRGSRSLEMPTQKYLHQHLTRQSQSVLSWSLYQITNNFASTNWKQKHKQHFKRAPRRTFHLPIQKRWIFPRADQFQNQLTTHPKEQS